MRRLSLDSADRNRDGDNTVRPVSYEDLLLVLLFPAAFTGFVTTDRRLVWAASATLPLGIIGAAVYLIFFPKHVFSPWEIAAAVLLGHVEPMVIGGLGWYRAYHSKEPSGELPRRVHPSDYALAWANPASAIAVHKCSRVPWFFMALFWTAGTAVRMWELAQGVQDPATSEERRVQWAIQFMRVQHVSAGIVATVCIVMASNLYSSMYSTPV